MAGPQGRPPGPQAAEPGLPSPLTRGATPGAVEIEVSYVNRNTSTPCSLQFVLGLGRKKKKKQPENVVLASRKHFLDSSINRSTLKITPFRV